MAQRPGPISARRHSFRLIIVPALLLLLATGLILVRSTARAERQLRESYRAGIESIATEVNSLLDEVLRTQALLSANDDLVDFFVSLEQFPLRKLYRPSSAAKALSRFQESRDVIATAYIFQRAWNRVLTGGGIVDPELYLAEHSVYQDYPLEFWRDVAPGGVRDVLVLPPNPRSLPTGETRIVLPLVVFTVGEFKSRNPFIIDLDYAWLGRRLAERRPSANSSISVYSSTGELLMQSTRGTIPSSVEARRGVTIDYSVQTPLLGTLRYVGYVPATDVRNRARQDLWVGLAIVAAGVAIALLAARRVAERIYSPIRQLVKLVGEPTSNVGGAARGEYEYLQTKITSLLDRNREMEVELQSAVPVVFELYLIRLLNRGITAETRHLRSFLVKHDLQFRDRWFRVAILQFHLASSGPVASESGTAAIYQLLARAVEQICRSHVLVLDEKRLAVVANFADPAVGNAVAERLEELPGIFQDDVSVDAFVGGLGRVHERLEGLCESYREAILAVAVANPFEFVVEEYDEAMYRDRRFVYTIEDETLVYSLLSSGNLDALMRHVHEIVDRNAARDAGADALRELYLQLYYTGLRVLYSRNSRPETILGDRFVPVEILSQRATDVHAAFTHVKEFFTRVCEHSRQPGRARLDVNEIAEYVKHHAHEQIYLSTLADEFGTTEKYVSKLFREQGGVSFHDFLSTIRVDHAREILESTTLPIGEIRGRCGFTSRNTFMRTFKKHVGMTPTEYREAARQRPG